MIRYALRCAGGHAFESWFASSGAYDSQRRRKLVSCPVCDSHEVEKALMAPKVARQRGGKAVADAPEVAESTAQTDPAVASEAASPLMMTQERELRAKLKELRDHVVANADNVGGRFPEEARKMHYGETEHRAIYGRATPGEAKSLAEEGIEVMPLPVLPGDRN